MTGRKFMFLSQGEQQFIYEYKSEYKPEVVECFVFYGDTPAYEIGRNADDYIPCNTYGDYGSYEL